MKQLKRYVNLPVHKEYISWEQYPFRHYKIKAEDSHHTFLMPDELYKLGYFSYSQTYQCYLINIYIGVNITTVQQFLWHKSITTTQLYSAILNQTMIHDLGKCFTGKAG